MVGDSYIRFKIPEINETDLDCPSVKNMTIYEKDCTTISSVFKNPNDLMSSLSDRFVYAELNNKIAHGTYEFCIGVTSFHFVIIPGLELVLEPNCKNALSKNQSSI
jgi:hypothetical protein